LIPETEKELLDLVAAFKSKGTKCRILGNGSNLFISRRKIREPVILTRDALSAYSISADGLVEAGASVDIRSLINACADKGLRAPVELFTIPATLGGAIYMNAARTTLGVSISDSLESCKVFDGRQICQMTRAECAFGYRKSVFHKRKDLVILGATFRYQRIEKAAIDLIRKESLKAGADKCYRKHKSAGSVFSECDFSLMERLRGMRIGGAMFAPKTTNCILNMGNAKPWQVWTLIKTAQIAHRLKRKTCQLEIEVW